MEKVLKFLKKYYICFIIVVLCFSLDLITKFFATNSLLDKSGDKEIYLSKEVISNFFYLTYARNTGGGWSIFAGQMWLFIAITIVSLVLFVYFLTDFDLKKRPLYSIGFAMMLGGTLGNFYERVLHGYVTDFLDFIIFGYDYPIFNVADMCLVIGVISLIIQLIFFSGQVTIFDKYKKNKPLEENKKEENKEI